MKQQTLGSESDLADRIARERKAREWSLADLSSRTGIERTNLFRIERGERPIRVAQLVALSAVFEIPVEDLLTPIELVEQEEANRILSWFSEALEEWEVATENLARARAGVRAYVESHRSSPAAEYLLRRLDSYLGSGESPEGS